MYDLENNRDPFYATSSFVQHSVAIVEFKLELQSENAQSGSKSTIFWAVWHWNLTDNIEKQKGTPPLSIIKLYASFHYHMWIQTGVTVRERLIWVKFDDFRAVWPLNLTDDLEKQ